MITVLIRARAGQPVEHLGITLTSLVPAVVHGLVGDAIVMARQADEAISHVADAAGVAVVPDSGSAQGWRQAAAGARGRWLLLLEAGDRMEPGWIPEAEQALLAYSPRLARLRRRPASLADRIGQLVSETLAPRALTPGLLVARDELMAPALAGSVRRLPIAIEALGRA